MGENNAKCRWFVRAKDKFTDHRIAEIVPEMNFSSETQRWEVPSYDLIRDMLGNEDLKFDVFLSKNGGKTFLFKLRPKRFIRVRSKVKTQIAVLKRRHEAVVQVY